MSNLLSLIVPWSDEMEDDEKRYRDSGCVKTAGTVYTPIPKDKDLQNAFDKVHKHTKLSVGAKALCKHYERKEKNEHHPFWKLPKGSEENKNLIAREHLNSMFSGAVWKNLHMLNTATKIYEIRNLLGYGMRWQVTDSNEIVFRGYLEPQLM